MVGIEANARMIGRSVTVWDLKLATKYHFPMAILPFSMKIKATRRL